MFNMLYGASQTGGLWHDYEPEDHMQYSNMAANSAKSKLEL